MSSPPSTRRIAVIAGAGPAGLTAALELLRRSNIIPVVFEAESQVGGISKTVNYRGNRMDLGGHRFFSKSDWVMRWWEDILPVCRGATEPEEAVRIHYHRQSRTILPTQLAGSESDAVMLIRQRLSRIFYRRRFFDYPLKLNARTLSNLGLGETLRIGMSYSRAQLLRRTPEMSLEDFLVNRFGGRLYQTFFKDYTEKVWGVPCAEISAEWGAQRIKGLSVTKALAHAMLSPLRSSVDTSQKHTETSLIERFLYPRLGPGQMWENVADQVISRGGEIRLGHRIIGVERRARDIETVTVQDTLTGNVQKVPCEFFVSTMPVRDLTRMLQPDDESVIHIAQRLPYRDFMTVGLLVRRMSLRGTEAERGASNGMPPDNWIYIQEPDVKIGRLQVFNNWSPALVADPSTIWLGLEYFCTEGDELWAMKDATFIDFAARELEKIGMIHTRDVLDGTLVRVPKAYPAYFGEYRHFAKVREFLDSFPNLYPIGRNGMHRYNNQDHSMLAADAAVTAMMNAGEGKPAIWRINTDENYHEEIKDVA